MKTTIAVLLAALGIGLVGCQTSPKTEEKKDSLSADVKSSLTAMKAEDPSLDRFLNNAHGYVVFPSVGKGGFIVGGAYGKGEVYERGNMVGWADITQATVGLQAGGQAFTEVIAFENKAALDQFMENKLELAAQASAVALKSGASANAKYTNGVAIFTWTKGGLMAEASVGGQRFRYTPVK